MDFIFVILFIIPVAENTVSKVKMKINVYYLSRANRNATSYDDILDDSALPPVQKASSIKKWFSQFVLEELDWPARSHVDIHHIHHHTGCRPGLINNISSGPH